VTGNARIVRGEDKIAGIPAAVAVNDTIWIFAESGDDYDGRLTVMCDTKDDSAKPCGKDRFKDGDGRTNIPGRVFALGEGDTGLDGLRVVSRPGSDQILLAGLYNDDDGEWSRDFVIHFDGKQNPLDQSAKTLLLGYQKPFHAESPAAVFNGLTDSFEVVTNSRSANGLYYYQWDEASLWGETSPNDTGIPNMTAHEQAVDNSALVEGSPSLIFYDYLVGPG
jgi:hypothetical protein